MAVNRVILKKSSVASKIPTSSDLVYGELAVNYTDGLIYFKDSLNAIRFFEEVNSFQNIDVSGQTTLTADGGSDTLTFVEGSGTQITTNDNTNELTITSNFVDSVSFNTADGVLTVGRTGSLADLTTNFDGRYLLQGNTAVNSDKLDNLDSTQFLRSDEDDTFSGTLTVDGKLKELVDGTSYDVVTDRDIGTEVNEIPLNQFLGDLAYTDAEFLGKITIDGNLLIRASEETTTTSTTETVITEFDESKYGSGKYMVQIHDESSGERQISEILVVHNGTAVFATEYGVVFTGTNPLASFDVAFDGNSMIQLLGTSASSSSTHYTVTENLIGA